MPRHRQLLTIVTVVLAAAGVGAASAVHAAGGGVSDRFDFGFKVGPEAFVWKEFDDNGVKLLDETGTRFGVNGYFGNLMTRPRGFIFNAEGRLYFGVVDYDGQTQSSDPSLDGQPLESDTYYTGLRLEGLAGYRLGFGTPRAGFGFDFLGGLGWESWVRAIDDSEIVVGGVTYAVSGGTEYYNVLYAKAAAGPSFRTPSWHSQVQLGFKNPFAVSEYIDEFDDDVTLEPEGRTSFYANWANTFDLGKRLALRVDLYYDSYRFDKSDQELVTDFGVPYLVWQPESSMDVWGVQVGLNF